MATLVLCLAGPMQSWGITSRFGERDAGSEPSKSGVLGLLCAALGRDRAEPIDDLVALKMAVRIDRPGVVMRDYHTALEVVNAEGTDRGTVLTNRYYLSDAAFWVGLAGERDLLEACDRALRNPVWPLFLGRKACLPSLPFWSDYGVVDAEPIEALSRCRWLGIAAPPDKIRVLVEDESGTIVRADQPANTFAERRFYPRRLRQEFVSCT